MRQHPPRASGAQHIADGIHHLPAGVFDGTAAGFGRRQQRFQQLPLPVVQVGGVIWSVHTPRLRHSARSSPSCLYASFFFLDTLSVTRRPGYLSTTLIEGFGGEATYSITVRALSHSDLTDEAGSTATVTVQTEPEETVWPPEPSGLDTKPVDRTTVRLTWNARPT